MDRERFKKATEAAAERLLVLLAPLFLAIDINFQPGTTILDVSGAEQIDETSVRVQTGGFADIRWEFKGKTGAMIAGDYANFDNPYEHPGAYVMVFGSNREYLFENREVQVNNKPVITASHYK